MSRCLLVRRLVGPLFGRSVMFVKKWFLEYQMVTKTYLPFNLFDISDSSDSSYSCDSNDSSDSSESNNSSDSSDRSKQKSFFQLKKFIKKNVMNLKN